MFPPYPFAELERSAESRIPCGLLPSALLPRHLLFEHSGTVSRFSFRRLLLLWSKAYNTTSDHLSANERLILGFPESFFASFVLHVVSLPSLHTLAWMVKRLSGIGHDARLRCHL